MKIGVVDLTMAGWTAGSVVSRTMARSLHAVDAEVSFFASELEDAGGLALQRPAAVAHLPGEYTLRRALSLPLREPITATARSAGSDVVLPLIKPIHAPGLRKVGWIPDFQHKHLPDLYSASVLGELDRRFETLAATSHRMLFSSEDSAADFRRFHPAHADRAAVASFPSAFVFQPPAESVGRTLEKYHLPSRFALVINQFWQHKNHRVVVEALGRLSRQGLAIPTVMVGQPSDFRDKQNQVLSDLFQLSASEGVWPHCCVLGRVSRDELLDLLRSATVLIQPSLFEGWNTSIQDAKALGCPVVASRIAVHQEQLPNDGIFFDPRDSAELASQLAAVWPALPSRPDFERERQSLAVERAFALDYGKKLQLICQQACQA